MVGATENLAFTFDNLNLNIHTALVTTVVGNTYLEVWSHCLNEVIYG
jgi:hypothetical protein